MSLPYPNLNLTLVADGEVNVPLVIIYTTQVIASFMILWLMDYIPRILGFLFFAGVFCGYPISFFTDIPVYEFTKDDSEWTNTFLKVVLVVFLATLPTIWFFQSERMESKFFGRFISFVLVANILYTLLFEISVLDTCSILRSACCLLMSISLFLRVLILEGKGQPVIYKPPSEPYTTVLFCPVTTLWVFAYTLWNISYSVAAFGILRPFKFCCCILGWDTSDSKYEVEVAGPVSFLMGYKLDRTYVKVTNEKAIHDTPDNPPLGWHFGYTRAITLGGYMTILPFIGMLPFVNDTFTTFEIRCNTEVAIYNVLTLILFVVDLIWAVKEYVIIRGNDANASGIQILNVDDE